MGAKCSNSICREHAVGCCRDSIEKDHPPLAPLKVAFGDASKPLPRTAASVLVAVESVRIKLGPVIGRVTESSATVLLEVSECAEVECSFIPISAGDDKRNGSSSSCINERRVQRGLRVGRLEQVEGVVSVKKLLVAKRPGIFFAEGLSPQTRYLVVFSQVHSGDTLHYIGRVQTRPLFEAVKRLRLVAVSSGVAAEVSGEQVEDSAWGRVMESHQTAESDFTIHIRGCSSGVGYETALTQAAKAISGFGDAEESHQAQMQEKAREAFRELYRIAWNHTLTRSCLSKNGAQIMCGGAILSGAECLQRLQQRDLAFEEREVLAQCAADVHDEYEASLWRIMPASTDYGTEGVNVSEVASCFHRYGQVGIFVLDSLKPPLHKLIEETLQREQDLKVVIITNGHPMAYGQGDHNSDPGTGNTQRTEDIASWLSILFKWKEAKQNAHEVLLLSGGTQIGMTTELRDSRTGLAIPEVIVSPTFGPVKAFQAPRAGDLGDSFAFVHHPLEGQHVFCTVDIDLQTRSGRPSVDVHLMGVPATRKASQSPVTCKS